MPAAQLGQFDGPGGALLNWELAASNANWVRDAWPRGILRPRVYHKDKIRIDQDGYVNAPTAPGLGYPIDRDALDKIMIRIDR